MLRMFVALPVPEPIRSDLDRFCDPRRDHGAEWSWTPSRNWHLTLAFLPDVDPDDIEELSDRLREAAARRAPFRFTLAGAGVFGHPDTASVLWARPTGADTELTTLARSVRSAVQAVGIGFDGRRFRPHLTLARSGGGVSATRWLRAFEAYVSEPWVAEELVLMDSVRPGGGGRQIHREVDRFAFASE